MSRFTHGGSGPSKKAIILATAVVAGLAAIVTTLPNSGVLPKSWTSEAEAASSKVTICHRTRSVTNPYRLITVNQSAIARNAGHKDHTGGTFTTTANYYKGSGSGTNTRDWGDIIPGGDTAGNAYNGSNAFDQNWTTSGRAFFPNGANAALCARMTAKQFYDLQVAARSGLTSAEQTAYGLDDSQIIADLNEQMANEDVATLAELGGSFTTSNITTSDTLVTTTTDPATSVGSTGATVNGTITAGTVGVRWQFQYGTSSTLATSTTTTISGATDNDVDMITSATASVSTALAGLSPSTTYYYRVIGVTNYGAPEEGDLPGGILSFTTSAAGSQTVTFDANSGTGTMATQTASTATALTTNAYTRTGYTFTGWNTAANGTGTTYADGASYPFTTSTTLYAQWTATPASATVTFDANSGTGTMATQTASTATALTTNAYTRTGYTFTGWNTAANGTGTSYADGASYPFTTSTTLYAQWTATPASATVTFDANSGTGTMATQTASTATALTTNAYTRTGYTFTGWNTAANGTGTTYADGASYPFTTSTTLYAQWTATPASATVTFDANSGTGTMATQTASTATALTTNAYTRTGYTFTGWNTAANGTGTTYANGASYPFTTSTTLYARWTRNAGGSTGSGNPSSGNAGGSTGGGNPGNGNTGGSTGGGNPGNGNAGGSTVTVKNPTVTTPTSPTTGSARNPAVTPVPVLTIPLTTASNAPLVVTSVKNDGPGSVDVDSKGQLKVTVPIGFTGTITVEVKGYPSADCTATAGGGVSCPVGSATPVQQTIQIPVAGPKPEVVPDETAAALPRAFAPRAGEVVVVGLDNAVSLDWKPTTGAQYYEVSSAGETVCMTVYSSCTVPSINRRSRTYVVSAVTPSGTQAPVAKGTGWAKPSGTRLASVYFDPTKAGLKGASIQALRKMVRDVKALGIGSVYVIGHTDTRGSMQYNRRLSAQRARNVHNWIEQHLEDATFDDQTPQGELRPQFPEAANPGDWRNRRVDVLVR